MTVTRFAGVLAVGLMVAACSKGDGPASGRGADAAWAPAQLTSVKGVPATEIQASLKSQLAGEAPESIDKNQWNHARRLYKIYGDHPLWLSADGLHGKRTLSLASAVLQTEQDGMRMDDYPIGPLATAIAGVQEAETPTAESLARADLILTASLAALGEDYLTGQVNPKEYSQSWHIDPQDERVDSALARAMRNPELAEALASMRPQDDNYTGLRKALDLYQGIVVKGGWGGVPDGKPVKPGERLNAARLAPLRQRLAAEGYVDPSRPADPAGVYGPVLAGAVAQFQARHAIVVDSMLGKETVDAMNKSAAFRAAQIAANLERLRWLPRNFGSRYISVNVPAFHLEAFDGGQKTLEMKVIVGEDFDGKSTPVFSDEMETVVFRPYWNVTTDIANKEIFPKMNANPGYLAANNYELYQESGQTRVRQKPGEKNSLGLVKFLFPNDYNIYLHDTPSRELFKEDVRAFSHGCIRVEKPTELAEWVLGWDQGKVTAAMNGSDNDAVKLSQKIPVYITYGTAYMRDGQIYFGNDLYGRDDKLVDRFLRGALPTPQMVQSVQALRRIAARS